MHEGSQAALVVKMFDIILLTIAFNPSLFAFYFKIARAMMI